MTPPMPQTAAEPRRDEVARPLRRMLPEWRAIRRPLATVSDEQLAEAERIMGVAPIAGRLTRMRPGY